MLKIKVTDYIKLLKPETKEITWNHRKQDNRR